MGGLGLPSASLRALSIVQPLPTLPAIFGLARLPMLDPDPSKGPLSTTKDGWQGATDAGDWARGIA